MPSRRPAAMKPIPANSCSRPSMASRSSAEAWPRREVGKAFDGADLAGARLAVVVTFDRFLGEPHVVIEVPTVPRGCDRSGALSARVDRLHRAVRADDNHELATLLGRDSHAVPDDAPRTTLDEEQIGAR